MKLKRRQFRIGDVVKLSDRFLSETGQFVKTDQHLKTGTVTAVMPIGADGAQLVTVEDAAFGQWKALNANLTPLRLAAIN